VIEDSTMFVAVSEISAPASGAAALRAAFTSRLGEVDAWPAFDHLEVWQDERDPTRFVMVSWWADKADFNCYMRSESHRRSHDRIDRGSEGPRPTGFSRFGMVAR
jgi:heme-degrading monooxygenase HmoA